ncbi:probable G-protein coupled receptor 139 [Chiloscyllium plagiosum]|uniref:probable G-protein coupled receptor 139 n=1 Tax=Chiloscyllium plagiosum TaxID=36176 RepID=UPI001CB85A34|nr:probable G-protein coupled receptor 139 [Chiloscyllium plagiosum]
MAVADQLVIITEVILKRITSYYFPGSFLQITVVCSIIKVLRRSSIDNSVWLTVAFSFDRFIAICYQKLKAKYCTNKNAAMVIAAICSLLCLKNVPFYFTYKPKEIINNVQWFCDIKSSFYTDAAWFVFDWLDTILTPLLPFAIIMLLNALTVRHILVANQIRKGLRGQSKGCNHNDPEMESRKKSIILLFAVSGSFILLWLLYVLQFFYYIIAKTSGPKDNDSLYVFEQVGYIFRSLSCCTNTFIYGVTQTKFREQFKNVMKRPFTLLFEVMNNKIRLK